MVTRSDYPSQSLLRTVEKLCENQLKQCLANQPMKPQHSLPLKDLVKPVKKAGLDALFRQGRLDVGEFPKDLLSSTEWDEGNIISAVAYRMRTVQRRFHEADKLEELSLHLLEENSENANILRLLLCLSDIENHQPQRHGFTDQLRAPSSADIKKIAKRKCPIYAGDYPFSVFNPAYTLYRIDSPFTTIEEPIMYPKLGENKRMDVLHAAKYKLPDFSLYEKNVGLFGLQSQFFSHKGLTDSAYEADSQTRLYGGLRQRTFELDVEMSYPKLTGQIDLMATISTSSLTPTDEGFVSPSSFTDDFSDLEWESEQKSVRKPKIYRPYFDYKAPIHDLNLWADCLTTKKLLHRSWETLGLPAGSTERRFYLTEAGSKVFDEIWQRRARTIGHLSEFFYGSPASELKWVEYDQSKLVELSLLVVMGVASDVFQLNNLAQMFIPRKDVHIRGVDPTALNSLLTQFSKWGTCYRRLLRFSSPCPAIQYRAQIDFLHSKPNEAKVTDRGGVFKAFVDAVQQFLRGYFKRILSFEHEQLTLLSFEDRLKNAGNQMEYIARLCRCGEPDMPSPPSIPVEDFPRGVALLSYLYREAADHPESNHHFVLLYLLRKSCVPYLRFIRDWIYGGNCWDPHGEFMLKVNIDYGGTRKDRQRWLKYIEPADPENPGSCVPSFLASLANDIYTCGKTISLMQFICPEHFLVVDGADAPALEMTFLKSKVRATENNWARYQNKMTKIESEKAVHWVKVEEDRKAAAHRAAILSRRAAQEEIQRMKEAIKLEKLEKSKIKGKELERLKKQAENAARERHLAREAEKEEDKRREEERQKKENKREAEKNRLIKEEKEKLISYYEDLNKAAEMRIVKTKWWTNRNNLNAKRVKFLLDDEKYWAKKSQEKSKHPDLISDASDQLVNEVFQPSKSSGMDEQPISDQFGDMTTEAKPELSELNLSSTPLALHATGPQRLDLVIGNPPDVAVESKLGRKSVLGKHVSTTTFEQHDGAEDLRLSRKSYPGRHVSDSTAGSLDDQPLEVKTHKRLVAGQNISSSTVFMKPGDSTTDCPSDGVASTKMFRKQVAGQNVSSSTVFLMPEGSTTDYPIDGVASTKTLKKQVPGQNVSSSTVFLNSEDSTASCVNDEAASTKTFKKQVAGRNVSASSVGNLMKDDTTDANDLSSTSALKKMVPGRSVTFSSVGSLLNSEEGSAPSQRGAGEVEHLKTFRKSVQGQNVTKSSIGDLLSPDYDETSSENSSQADLNAGTSAGGNQLKTFRKMISGQNVSQSTVGDLFSPDGEDPRSITDRQQGSYKALKKSVQGHNVSESTIGDLLSCGGIDTVGDKTDAPARPQDLVQNKNESEPVSWGRKKKIPGQSITESSIEDFMKLEPMIGEQPIPNSIIDRLEKFSLTNKFHGRHHSQSTVGSLIYHDSTNPWEEKAAVINPQILRPSVNSAKRHPSFSTIQLLMYREVDEKVGEDVVDTGEAFHLQLPTVHGYTDPLRPLLDYSSKERDFSAYTVDLMKTVTGKSAFDEFENEVMQPDVEAVDMQLLPALLRRCIIRPVTQQISLANRCIMNYFMTGMELPRHFEMMRHFCFMEDGEFSQILCTKLFEKMHGGCSPIDLLNPVVLESLISQAVQGSGQRDSPHAKRLAFSLYDIPTAFSAQDPNSLSCFTLKYEVGWPCNIVITEANQVKYGQVFGFLLQLKYVMWALNDVSSKLSSSKSSWKSLSKSELRQLHLFRHEMQNFVKVMQGYVSTQVVHVCWHEFLQALKAVKCLEDLHSCHVEYLRKCIFRCLLTKKTKMVMNVITDIFKTILCFWTQLFSKSVTFAELKVTYSNFSKYSGFLFRVVSKLVDHGYQPPLEDFLLRLNYNGFYERIVL